MVYMYSIYLYGIYMWLLWYYTISRYNTSVPYEGQNAGGRGKDGRMDWYILMEKSQDAGQKNERDGIFKIGACPGR